MNDLHSAYEIARIINHHQGIALIQRASMGNSWQIDMHQVTEIWTSGCIIKSNLMSYLAQLDLLSSNISGENKSILEDEQLSNLIQEKRTSLDVVVAAATLSRVVTPTLSSASQFLNGICECSSAANIIQAQRDFFGAHKVQTKSNGGKYIHIQW